MPSATRRKEDYLADSRKRLRELICAPEGVEILWEDDLGKMLGEEKSRVALVHMDGNDLGKLFRKKLERRQRSASGKEHSLHEGTFRNRFSGQRGGLQGGGG